MVHTMGNSHPGGESGGFIKELKSCIAFRVRRPDTIPTRSGSAMLLNNKFLFLFIVCTSTITICRKKKNIAILGKVDIMGTRLETKI